MGRDEGRRGFQALWSHWLKVCDSSEQRLQLSVSTTFLFPYLWLVPCSNSFFCCFWHSVQLHTLPRLCGLNDTLQPVSALLPQGTTTHSGQNEGNGFDFLPLFTHQIGRGTRTVRCSWLSWKNKPMPHRVCVCAYVIQRPYCVCWAQYNVCWGTGELISTHHCSTSVLTLCER